jgi:hypothetical protein
MQSRRTWVGRGGSLGALAGLAALLTLVQAAPASAALGGAFTSVDADRLQMRATRMLSVTTATHAMHAMTLESGGSVKEFANNDGVVFAITWAGPGRPDLRQLLGDRFDKMQATFAIRAGRRLRSAITIDQNDFVIHMGGHSGAFHGVAYLPGLVPSGFDMSILQ